MYVARISGNKPCKENFICAIFSHLKKRYVQSVFRIAFFTCEKHTQSPPRVESFRQSEHSTPMAYEKHGLEISPLEVCVLKTWLWLPSLVHFRKQQRNIFNILIASSSASAGNRLSKSDLCHSRRNIQHFYKQRKSVESEFVFAQREAPS